MAAPLNAKYTVELFREGGEGSGIDRILGGDDDLTAARALYRHYAAAHPGRLVMLCDRARILARSDRPATLTR